MPLTRASLAVAALLVVGAGVAAMAARPAEAGVPPQPAGITAGSVSPASPSPGGKLTFTTSCANPDSIAAWVSGQAVGLPRQLPMRAVGPVGRFSVATTLPRTLPPGSYTARVDCADGTSAVVGVHVVPGGPGLMSTPLSAGLSVAGLALLGVGFGCGALALRRRPTIRGSAPASG